MKNFFSPNEFRMSLGRAPDLEFSCQKVSIPGMGTQPTQIQTPFNRLQFSGDKLDYDELEVSFIVSSDLENYAEIFNWLKGSTYPEDFKQYKDLKTSDFGVESDITIITYDAQRNPSFAFSFTGCIPLRLSPMMLDVTRQTVEYVTVDALFAYQKMNFKKANT